MPLYLGSKTVSENINMGDTVIQNTFDLFDVKWSDHIINNESWMCADDFNWIDGSVFSAAWNELKSEWDLATVDSTPAQQDVIGDITINYWKSPKGYKLVEYGGDTPETNENLLQQLYDEVGIAWYYLIDTTGQIRFKLPRTKYHFEGLRTGSGNFIPESLPNITGLFNGADLNGDSAVSSGAFLDTENNAGGVGSGTSTIERRITFDASRSSSIYKNGANVQEKATEMYLYFYITDSLRTPLESNLNTFITETKETLNEKVNVSDYSADKTLIENDINTLETTKITQTDLDNTINTQRTNCITKIPQDIKLELNDGTLTLKAGSKVYVPNGAGVFDVVTVQSDKSWGQTTYASGNIMLFYRSKYNDLFALNDYACYSGSSAPTAINNMIWYDITSGKIKWTNNKGSTWNDEGLSLPLNNSPYTNGTGFTSIDQVFNGFGFIGSHWYELKGNEGKARNGRNTDGSLNNSTRTTTNVIIHPCGTGTAEWFLMSGFDGGFRNADKRTYFVQDEMPSVSSYSSNYAVWESPKENIIRVTSDKGVTWAKTIMVNCGECSTVDSRITSFNPKTVFQAVDSNNALWASTASKPSNKSITYSLGASGSKYTISANGWFHLIIISGKANAQATIINNTTGIQSRCLGNDETGLSLITSLPVKAGDSITVNYTATGSAELKLFLDEGAL